MVLFGATFAVFLLIMVPRVGIEPTLPKKPDFESSASANSAISAHFSVGDNINEKVILSNKKRVLIYIVN